MPHSLHAHSPPWWSAWSTGTCKVHKYGDPWRSLEAEGPLGCPGKSKEASVARVGERREGCGEDSRRCWALWAMARTLGMTLPNWQGLGYSVLRGYLHYSAASNFCINMARSPSWDIPCLSKPSDFPGSSANNPTTSHPRPCPSPNLSRFCVLAHLLTSLVLHSAFVRWHHQESGPCSKCWGN